MREAREAYRRALEAIGNGRYSDALPDLDRALEKYPRFVQAYIARAGARFAQRNLSAAAEDYRRALEVNENLATPLYGLARIYEALGDRMRAVDYYQRYVASSAPDVQETHRANAARRVEALRGGISAGAGL